MKDIAKSLKLETAVYDIVETREGTAVILYTNLRRAEDLMMKYRSMGLGVVEARGLIFGKSSPYDRSKITPEELKKQTAIVVHAPNKSDVLSILSPLTSNS